MSIKCFLRLVLMVSINAKNVVPFSLSLLSGIACLASHFKTGSIGATRLGAPGNCSYFHGEFFRNFFEFF